MSDRGFVIRRHRPSPGVAALHPGSKLSILQPKKPFRIAVRDALLVRGTDWKLIQESARLRHGLKRMVGREHDPLDADFKQQVEDDRCEIEAAEGVVNIVSKIGADRTIEFCHRHLQVIEPLQHEGERLAHMTDHDLQFRISIEYSAEDKANDMNRGFDVPAPARAREHGGDYRRKAAI